MITSQAIVGHVKWAAIGAWGGKLASLVIFVLLTRLLPVEAIGAVSLIAIYLALLQLLGEAGLAEYLVQQQGRDTRQEHTLFWLQLVASSLVAAGFMFAAPLVAMSLPASVPGEALVLWMAVSLPLVAAARVPDAIMRKSLAFKQLAYRNLVAALCGGIAGVICAFKGFGVWALVVKQLVENSVALLAVMIGARFRPRFMFSRATLGEPLRYGLAVFGARAIGVVHGRLDSLIVGWVLGATALGFYSVALRVYQHVSEMFNSVIDSVSVPLMARVKHDPAALKSMFLRLVRGGSLLSMTAFASLCVLASPFVEVVFGARWEASSAVLRWLALAGVIIGPFWFNGGLLLATGYPVRWMSLLAVYVVVGCLLFPLSAHLGGFEMVALAFAARSLAMSPMNAAVALRAGGIPMGEFYRAWLPSALISASVACVAGLAGTVAARAGMPNYVALTVGIAAGVIAFFVIVPFGVPRMWRQLIDMLRRRA